MFSFFLSFFLDTENYFKHSSDNLDSRCMASLPKLESNIMFYLLSLPVHSGLLKMIDYLKQICLAHPLSFECFHCSQRNSVLSFYFEN